MVGLNPQAVTVTVRQGIVTLAGQQETDKTGHSPAARTRQVGASLSATIWAAPAQHGRPLPDACGNGDELDRDLDTACVGAPKLLVHGFPGLHMLRHTFITTMHAAGLTCRMPRQCGTVSPCRVANLFVERIPVVGRFTRCADRDDYAANRYREGPAVVGEAPGALRIRA
jgi:hypothetical protein